MVVLSRVYFGVTVSKDLFHRIVIGEMHLEVRLVFQILHETLKFCFAKLLMKGNLFGLLFQVFPMLIFNAITIS